MKNNVKLRRKIRKLIDKAKRLNLIKSSDEAFKDFPVEKEVHEGNINAYKQIGEKI